MKRRLFTILSALSLLLFVAVVVLWVRSRFTLDNFGWNRWNHPEGKKVHWAIGGASRSGVVAIGSIESTQLEPSLVPAQGGTSYWYWRPNGSGHAYFLRQSMHSYGFYCATLELPPDTGLLGIQGWVLCMPWWFASAVSGLLPALWYWQYARQRRDRRRTACGFCPACGYDLRATPDRCPECGWVPQANAEVVS